MANPLKKLEGQKYVIEMGNGAQPEVFTRIGSVTNNLSFSSMFNIEEVELPDLDDFDAPYSIDRTVRSHDITIEGAGMIDARYIGDLFDLHMGDRAGEAVNVKFKQMSAANSVTVTGTFILEQFSINAEYKKASEVQQTWKKAGTVSFTKNA